MEINNIEELKPYYNEDMNAYVFTNTVTRITFDLCAEDKSIVANNLSVGKIIAKNIICFNDFDAIDVHAVNVSTDTGSCDNMDVCQLKVGDTFTVLESITAKYVDANVLKLTSHTDVDIKYDNYWLQYI